MTPLSRIVSLILLITCVYAVESSFDPETPIPCEHIYTHPDQCSFVKKNCQEYSTGIVDYLSLYYCAGPYRPVVMICLFSLLIYLFAAIGVVASDFFCPNLQTIASSLNMSESLAGVTFLAFGNASPDLFTTFSALNSGSGSLAVGELVGAAFFIVTVVAGGMAVIQPFHAKRVVFIRDVTFFTGAVAIVGWIVYDHEIHLFEALGLVLYYCLYVAVVVGMTWWKHRRRLKVVIQPAEEVPPISPLTATENTPLIHEDHQPPAIRKGPKVVVFEPSEHDLDIMDEEEARDHAGHLGHIMRPVSPKMMRRLSLRIDTNNLAISDSLHAPVSSKTYRPPLTPRVGIRPSIFGAIEFRNALNAAQHASEQLKLDMNESAHRRNQSMPSTMFTKRSATSPCEFDSRSAAQKRANKKKRPSDIADMVISQEPLPLAAAPSPSPSPSSQESVGMAEDYFSGFRSSASRQQQQDEETQYFQPRPRDRHANVHSPLPGLSLQNIAEGDRRLRASSPHSPSMMPGSNNNLPRSNSPQSITTLSSRSATHSPTPSIRSVMSEIQAQHQGSPWVSNLKLTKKIMFWWHVFEKNHQDFSEFIQDVWRTLFPTVQNWSTKSISNAISSVSAIPIVFLLRITLPVAEDDSLRVDDIVITVDPADDDESSDTADVTGEYIAERDIDGMFESPLEETVEPKWSRWLIILQSLCAPTFIALSLAVNDMIAMKEVVGGLFVGMCLAALMTATTERNVGPSWMKYLAFVGFVVSLNWIYAVANEVVGLLQAIGLIFNISGAILGLTVFAMGNSLGDLVANISMAKMGLPNMAISACYAGPLLNMVLGLGIAATYNVWVTGENYELELAPTIMVSSVGLMLVLVTAFIIVHFNRYKIDKWIGLTWIGIYFITTALSIFIEVRQE